MILQGFFRQACGFLELERKRGCWRLRRGSRGDDVHSTRMSFRSGVSPGSGVVVEAVLFVGSLGSDDRGRCQQTGLVH